MSDIAKDEGRLGPRHRAEAKVARPGPARDLPLSGPHQALRETGLRPPLYKQTILGPLWFILNPLFTTIMYSFVFGGLAKIPTDGVPQTLFYYGGTMLWGYFASCLNSGADVFSGNAGLFGKVYFPRLTVPY